MVILFVKLLTKVAFLSLVNLVFAFMPVIILGVGVLIMLRIVKVGTLSTRISQGVGHLARKIFKILTVLIVSIFTLIPKIYRSVRRYCEEKGANSFVSNLIATIVIIIII